MLTGYKTSLVCPRLESQGNPPPSSALNRLLAAAVVNRNFRELLLKDPCQALIQGYQGEFFPLSRQERDLILSIRAKNLENLANQLITLQEGGPTSQGLDLLPADHDDLVLEPNSAGALQTG